MPSPPLASRLNSCRQCIRFAGLLGLWIVLALSHAMGSATPSGVILVNATVEGKAARLLLDTGAARSCLDATFAEHLHLTLAGVERVAMPYAITTAGGLRVHDLGFQTFHLADLEMLTTDLARISLAAGTPIDGILGSDVLKQFTVAIDFTSGVARFSRPPFDPGDAIAVHLTRVDDLYFVPIDIQGTSLHLLLDSGTNASSVSSQAWSRIGSRWHPDVLLDGIRSSGSAEPAKFVLIPSLYLGGLSSTEIPLRVQPPALEGLFARPDFDGLLGTDILRHFIVTLDLDNELMYLTRDPNTHPDLERFSTIGIQFAKDSEGGFTIMAVWSPSPAARAGLKIGDRIVAVNRQKTSGMSPDELSRAIHGRPGTEVQLAVDSSDGQRAVSLAINALLYPSNVGIR